jgi:ER membrane protein complex subunit 3
MLRNYQILTGVLRHYATVLMTSTPKKQEQKAIREQRSLMRGINLRTNANNISPSSFQARKAYMISAFQSGAFLKAPKSQDDAPPNPMSDPAAMDGMMNMMKGNMAMIVPQTLIMGWINAFFSGFVVLRMPFPLTPRFKAMLQSGVATRDLDVRWVSSISLYFLCMFGLQSVFIYLLGNENGKLSICISS